MVIGIGILVCSLSLFGICSLKLASLEDQEMEKKNK